jgi:DNA repair protein RecO (recombination protein O)
VRRYETAEALVIRTVDFSETSRIVTLSTPEFGKLGALAKGGRRAKGAFEGALDLLSVCRIGVLRKPNAELDLLTEAKLEERFTGLASSLPALYAGYFLAEALDALTQPHDPHPALHHATVASLRELAAGADRLRILVRWCLRLLAETGFAISLDRCVGCGQEPPEREPPALAPVLGGLVCLACRQRQAGWFGIAPDALAELGVWAGEDEAAARALRPVGARRGELWRAVLAFVLPLMGRPSRVAKLVAV